jgi:hypothetical protein
MLTVAVSEKKVSVATSRSIGRRAAGHIGCGSVGERGSEAYAQNWVVLEGFSRVWRGNRNWDGVLQDREWPLSGALVDAAVQQIWETWSSWSLPSMALK